MVTCNLCNKEFKSKQACAAHQRVHSTTPRSNIDIIKLIERNKQKLINNEQQYYQSPKHCLFCNKLISYIDARRKAYDKSKKSRNMFCNRSCAASYNNTHKTHGTTRSKLERWLELKLIDLYPNIEFKFNKKDAINSELDIYLPELKLAFELNGIYHYEPIHGIKVLTNIQNNDKRKFQACLEQGIELCIIDSSKLVYFKETNALPFLDIIKNIINTKLNTDLDLE